MDERLQRRVQRYGWDKASDYYEKCWRDQLEPAKENLFATADIQRGEHILDIACGTGLISFQAMEQVGISGSVTGIDISDNMISQAVAHPGSKAIRFLQMDGEHLEFEKDFFDVALCGLGLMYFPNPMKALKEMHRVLKPGGRAIVAVWGKRENCGWASIFGIVDAEVTSEVCPMFFNLGNPETISISLKQAGFHRVEERRIKTMLMYSNDEEALNAAFKGGPVALAYHRFSESVKSRVHEAYLDSLSAYRDGEGYAVPGEFVISAGYK